MQHRPQMVLARQSHEHGVPEERAVAPRGASLGADETRFRRREGLRHTQELRRRA